ncbi:CpsB/CapC family capsule biosynthesis tyrosine phosphatase [Alkalicoccobacillus gibsonii]|uniref:Tyrosine-protein phosphatase n=1 Tax=Alkalicoccobacillus gibsonii TaxID=79881 RepID=A0ABU9VP33_9BACI
MIDIHSHILPGLDDGASSLTHSVEMARTAVEEGITTIIATPHHANPYFDTTLEQMLAGVESVNEALQAEKIPLVVKPGQEIRLFGELIDHLALGRSVPLTGEGRYVLVEFPTNSVPAYSERLFYDLAVQGYTPVIAHPERNSVFLDKPHKLFEFVRNGALSQITTSSVTGHFGKTIQAFTNQLMEANLAHILASDAHNLQARTFRMKAASDLIEEEHGTDLLYQFQENAELLVRNQNLIIHPPEPIQKKKKKRFSFFR